METVNIGILAHVDAGKTSLTERLLFDTGVIDRLGSVDSGTTQTDTGDIERQRGITIRSAVAAFTVGDRLVNLIDTPGHSDFVAEVERALGVLDGAILVVSAVEGVQPHTRLLMKTLRALRMPTLIFVNKIDRMGARGADLEDDITRMLGPGHPVLFGSALTGAGVPALLDAIGILLPPSPPPETTLRARVFAIERSAKGEKVAYVRSYGGELRKRQRVNVYRRDQDDFRAQVTALHVVGAGAQSLTAGHIAKVHGLAGARIGDQIGSGEGLDAQAYFAPPSLETTVRADDEVALHKALMNLADEDPLIQTRVTADGETSVLLYGEVQKEVIAATLASVYGIEATFAPSQIVHVERPIGVGHAVEYLGRDFLATVGLRVEPGDVLYRIEVERGVLPLSFHTAIEESVVWTLEQGNYGWPVTGITVTLTHSGFCPSTAAGDFRAATRHVLVEALAMARTRVYEPCQRFELEVPAERLGVVISHLAHIGARIDEVGEGRLSGELPARLAYEFKQRLPALSNGEGLWTSSPGGDRVVAGEPPRRGQVTTR